MASDACSPSSAWPGVDESRGVVMRGVMVWRALWAVASLAVAWSSLLPPDDLPPSLGLSDKVLHLMGYGVLGVLAVLSGLRWPWAITAVVGFGLVMEVAQGLLGYRSFEWADLGADAIGAVAGAVITSRVLDEVRRSRTLRDQEAKRQRRRDRREQERETVTTPRRNRAKAASRKGAPTWQQVSQRQGPKCWLCGTRTYADDRHRDPSGREHLGKTYPCVDLVVSIDAGGTYEDANVRLAHRHCAAARHHNPSLNQFGRPPRTYP